MGMTGEKYLKARVEQEKATAFRQGIGARKKDTPRQENPYQGVSLHQATAWLRGWDSEDQVVAMRLRSGA